jgi:ADP-heptose:LPS heptosyltransferase
VVPWGEPLPPFDFHCPLMSLPLAFATEIATIPPVTKLHVPADRLAQWQTRFANVAQPKVGLVWAGRSGHGNDRIRSTGLARLSPLLSTPGIQFVSLQHELREGDAALLASYPSVLRLGEEFADFADTAAVISLLDLVVTVDTSVAHLAAALGKPTWILLPIGPDFRWLLGREDSPWYPSARLFRQQRFGDWESVIQRVSAEIGTLTAQPSGH